MSLLMIFALVALATMSGIALAAALPRDGQAALTPARLPSQRISAAERERAQAAMRERFGRF